jgi:hypothetical protein
VICERCLEKISELKDDADWLLVINDKKAQFTLCLSCSEKVLDGIISQIDSQYVAPLEKLRV